MPSVITYDGLNLAEDVSVGDVSEVLDTISVGTSTDSVSQSDSSMFDSIYSQDDAAANVTVERGSSDGEMRFVIEVTGGNEVSGGVELTEFGVLGSSDTLFYHETVSSGNGIDVPSGTKKTIEIIVTVTDIDPGESDVALTTVGLNLIADILLGESSDEINTVALGDSTNNVSASDTTMFSEVYRDDEAESNVTVGSSSNDGEIVVRVTVSAGPDSGDEVSAGTDISEFGVISDDGVLVLHETRSAVTLQDGDTKTFQIPFDLVQ